MGMSREYFNYCRKFENSYFRRVRKAMSKMSAEDADDFYVEAFNYWTRWVVANLL